MRATPWSAYRSESGRAPDREGAGVTRCGVAKNREANRNWLVMPVLKAGRCHAAPVTAEFVIVR